MNSGGISYEGEKEERAGLEINHHDKSAFADYDGIDLCDIYTDLPTDVSGRSRENAADISRQYAK